MMCVIKSVDSKIGEGAGVGVGVGGKWGLMATTVGTFGSRGGRSRGRRGVGVDGDEGGGGWVGSGEFEDRWGHQWAASLLLGAADTSLIKRILVCRCIWHWDNLAPGQFSTRTIWHWDNLAPGQISTRTIWHQDNLAPRKFGTRTIWH